MTSFNQYRTERDGKSLLTAARARVMIWLSSGRWQDSFTVAKSAGMSEPLTWSVLYGLWKMGLVERRRRPRNFLTRTEAAPSEWRKSQGLPQ
jgi:hypothetical protein